MCMDASYVIQNNMQPIKLEFLSVVMRHGRPKTEHLVLKEVCCALGVYMRSGRCQPLAFGELVNNYQKSVMPRGCGW